MDIQFRAGLFEPSSCLCRTASPDLATARRPTFPTHFLQTVCIRPYHHTDRMPTRRKHARCEGTPETRPSWRSLLSVTRLPTQLDVRSILTPDNFMAPTHCPTECNCDNTCNQPLTSPSQTQLDVLTLTSSPTVVASPIETAGCQLQICEPSWRLLPPPSFI